MPVNLELDTATRDVLDFSRLIINCQEDLDEALQKIPDYRTRPEKIRLDDLRIDASNFSFSITKSELQAEDYNFLCPIPHPLNQVNLDDVRSMDINWLMLTEFRPETKQDEDIFNRIVQLERVTYKTVLQEQNQLIRSQHKAKNKKIKSKIGGKISGDRGDICPECEDEHCSGICKEFLYEAHERLPPVDEDDQRPQPLNEGKEGERKGKKKIKKKVKKKTETVNEETKPAPKDNNNVTKKRKNINKVEKLVGSKGGSKDRERTKSKGRKSKSTSELIVGEQENNDSNSAKLEKPKTKKKMPKSNTNSKLSSKKETLSDKILSPETKKKSIKTNLTELKGK